ncbi:PBP1A family penicillin-binding protein [Lachnospiraceae bacterium ZAX-1]
MKKKKKKKNRFFWFFVKFQICLMLIIGAGVGVYYFGGYAEKVSAMQKEAKQLVKRSTEDTFRSVLTSLVYDTDGELISTLKGEKDVYYLAYEEIPNYAKAAVVSIEDKKFFSHGGIDIKAILRAAKAMIENGEVTEGASTITQQLARNIFLNMDKTWERKIEEIFIAVELEKIYSKNKILEYYLNNIYFANGYYGIQAASKGYFNADVNSLSLSQLAFLCAIPNNPTLYDPVTNIENTLKRRDRILNQMVADGKLANAVSEEAKATQIVLERPVKEKNDYVETYTYYCAIRALMAEEGFVFQNEFQTEGERAVYDTAYSALYAQCQKSLFTGGYRIYTSISLNTQQQLQQSVDENLSAFTEQTNEGIYTLQSAAVCIDNRTGYVKAIVGGRSQDVEGYTLNRAYQSFRQPGSAIKPLIVYTPILEQNYTPDTLVLDEKTEEGPSNASGYYEGEITLRHAVEQSKNTVAWNLLEAMGPSVGLSYLRGMQYSRLKSDDERPGAALGGFTIGVSPLEMAVGYETLVNDGKYREPTCIVRIRDAQGELILETEQEETVIYKENAARTMTDILESVMTSGTARGLALTNMPCAGKTGTTNENKDGWFVGYTRYYTTSVWVGYDMPKELPALSGATYPGSIWKNFMQMIHEGYEPMAFIPYIRYDQGEPLNQEELFGDILDPSVDTNEGLENNEGDDVQEE